MPDQPAPTALATDEDSAPYWDALRQHRLRLLICISCAGRRIVPTPSCPYCGHPEHRSEWSSGNGTIYSYITVYRAFDPAFRDQVPYSIATIDLDDSARALGRVTGTAGIGARVEPNYVDHEGWTELRFRVIGQR